MRLSGKRVLVTGGSRGIGRAIALAVASEGARIAINYARDTTAADEVIELITSSGGKAIGLQADVTSQQQVRAMVAAAACELGGLDVVVNNAGVCHFIDFFEVTEQDWDFHQNVNSRGVFFVSQAAAALMRVQGGGSIVNVTSISGEKATNPEQVPYCTSKGAANMLTRVMALALAPYNIRVNAVLPGTIETDINRNILESPGARQAILDATPLASLGAPEQIAEAVIYFASDASAWTTGALLAVDGGFML